MTNNNSLVAYVQSIIEMTAPNTVKADTQCAVALDYKLSVKTVISYKS